MTGLFTTDIINYREITTFNQKLVEDVLLRCARIYKSLYLIRFEDQITCIVSNTYMKPNRLGILYLLKS